MPLNLQKTSLTHTPQAGALQYKAEMMKGKVKALVYHNLHFHPACHLAQ